MKNRISDYRKQANLTHQSLADLLGCAKSTIIGYETEYRNPGLPECRQIVATLNTALGKKLTIDDVFPE